MTTPNSRILPARLVARYHGAQPGTYYQESVHRTAEALGNAVRDLARAAAEDGYQCAVVVSIRRAE